MLRQYWRRFHLAWIEHAPEFALALFVAVFLVIHFASNIFYSIQPGYYGVMWKRFEHGTVLDKPLGEGLHIIFPWDKIFLYDARVQLIDQDFDVLSSDGLKMTVNIAYRFNLVPNQIPLLHSFVGPGYRDVLVTADIGARARDIFAKNTPEGIFSERRNEIETTIAKEVRKNLYDKFNPAHSQTPVEFVKLWDVLIRSITLPPVVAAAIERKNEAKQTNEAYDFRLLSEAKEAERKQIEAHGVREFQDIVATGLTDNYLRWRGIEATLALSNSPNSKIVVIGGGPGGLPIILGNLEDHKPPAIMAPPGPASGPPTAPTTVPPTGGPASAAAPPPASAAPLPGPPPQRRMPGTGQ